MTAGLVAASANGRVGLPTALDILRDGGGAVDAAVAAVRAVEDDRSETGVGTGGIPNLAGEVELDALVMDGRTRDAGAVAALTGFPHPIDVARRVLDVMPHVLLAGEGAALFARQQGFQPAELLTAEARAVWEGRVGDAGAIDPRGDRYRLPSALVAEWQRLLHDSVKGTTNVLVRDGDGHMATAVSTSGWGFKWPGRVGDSAIPGAGGYADDRRGAAACTGYGELALRSATALRVVSLLTSMPADDALALALRELSDLPHPWDDTVLSVIALTPPGTVAAASTQAGTTYVTQGTDDEEPDERPRAHIVLDRRR